MESKIISLHKNYEQSTLSQGLIAWWNLDGRNINWTSNSTGSVLDRSGQNNDGTISNINRNFASAIGRGSQGLKFNTLSNAGISLASEFIGAGDVTIAFWWKPLSSVGNQYVFDNGRFQIFTSTNNRLSCTSVAGGGVTSAVNAVQSNIWQHWIITRASDGTVSLYKNGIASGTSGNGGTPVVGTSNLTVCCRRLVDLSIGGLIDDIRIYNRILSNTEILLLYNMGQTKLNFNINYSPYVAGFNGSNTYLQSNSSSVGFTQGRTTTTFSVWLQMKGGDGTDQEIIATAANRTLVRRNASNNISFQFLSAGGVTQVAAVSSVTKTVADGWFHLYITFDTTDTSKRFVYFNGIEDTSVNWITYRTTAGMQLIFGGTPAARIGAGDSALRKFNGNMADLYHSDRYLPDITKFFNDGRPVYLGYDGMLPDGQKPGLYFSRIGSANNWKDSANKNAFFTIGTLTKPIPP